MTSFQFMDMEHWKRAEHCRIFLHALEPQYCVTFELDVSHFLPFVRSRRLSFTLSLIYTVTCCAEKLEEFRYRFIEGKPALLERVHTAFTWLDPHTELFKFVRVDMADSMEAYVERAKAKAESQKTYFPGPPDEDVFVFSPMPWIAYTHVSHTVSGRKDCAVPLFDWGKYTVREGRIILPFSVQVHHSFVDGIHIGRLADELQSHLDDPARQTTR